MSEDNQPSVHQGVIEYVAKNNDGIKLEDNPNKWWNYGGADKANMQAKVSKLNQGDLVTLILVPGQEGQYGDVLVEKPASDRPNTPEKYGNSSFMEDYKGIEELLTEAYNITLGTIEFRTELLHYDFEAKTAVARCTVQGDVGFKEVGEGKKTLVRRTAQGVGDASIESIGTKNIEPHFIRMAETRAMVRALRWYTDNGKTAAEEIPGLEEGSAYEEVETKKAEEEQQ